jgi:hypothetical protein
MNLKDTLVLIERLNLSGKPLVLPGFERDALPQLFIDLDFKFGAEIGVRKGQFTEYFCKAGLKMYAIDPWLAYEDYDFPDRNFQKFQDLQFGLTQALLAPYDVTFIRKKSMDALVDVPDDSLDFVYIDGHHGLKYVVEDLWEWTKKVKRGGIISGHDYGSIITPASDPYCIHVEYAVRAFTEALNINKWFVLGQHQKGGQRQRIRSWLWFNERN